MSVMKPSKFEIKQIIGTLLALVLIFLYYNVSNLRIPDICRLYTCQNATPSEDMETGSCVFPKLEPWSEEVKPFVKTPNPLTCLEKMPILFESNLTHIIPVKSDNLFEKHGLKSCCYRRIVRPKNNDYKFGLTIMCFDLRLNEDTKVPVEPGYDFVAIECKKFQGGKKKAVIVDMHAFPLASAQRMKDDAAAKNKTVEIGDKLNVLLLGFDSNSRMNFHRTMPQSHKYLTETLNAIEMKGYNRVGPFTHQNLPTMLTSHHPNELSQICIPGQLKPVDSCPFIWKDYKASGYYTGYAEDATSTFQIDMKGFTNPPTDFYLRPFSLAVARYIGAQKRFLYQLCAGPRLWLKVMLNFIDKVREATEMQGVPLFFFNWMSGLGHDDAGYMFHADEPLLSMLKKLHESNYLNKTVLILASDHGLEYGELRNTIQGGNEANLPLLFYILPPWFKEKYPKAYENFEGNSKRLMTVYDIHATWKSILDLKQLEDKSVSRMEKLYESTSFPRGISLFLPIPQNRTCEQAGVHKYYCSCVRKSEPTDVDNPIIQKGAQLLVDDINKIFVKERLASKCEKLALKRVISARKRFPRDTVGGKEDGFIIRIETTPGLGITEGEVKVDGGKVVIDGDYSRINPYGSQSRCVSSRYSKMFCYCKQ